MAQDFGERTRRSQADTTGEAGRPGPFSGVGVALVTIFDAGGGVDEVATARHAENLVQRGMRAVLVNGTTGEAGTLTDAERVTLIQAVRKAVPAEVPVIAGTGGQTTQAAIGLTSAAADIGADALLAYPPPGCQASELRAFFAAVAAAASGRPLLAYHVPWVSAPGVPVDALPDLPVAGIKDSSGSPDRLLDQLAHYDGATYIGSSALLALSGPMGGAGAILALANIEPELSVLAFSGDAAAQLRLADAHLAVRAGGPAALKRLLAERGGLSATSRLP